MARILKGKTLSVRIREADYNRIRALAAKSGVYITDAIGASIGGIAPEFEIVRMGGYVGSNGQEVIGYDVAVTGEDHPFTWGMRAEEDALDAINGKIAELGFDPTDDFEIETTDITHPEIDGDLREEPLPPKEGDPLMKSLSQLHDERLKTFRELRAETFKAIREHIEQHGDAGKAERADLFKASDLKEWARAVRVMKKQEAKAA
jgi:hypothetical protein